MTNLSVEKVYAMVDIDKIVVAWWQREISAEVAVSEIQQIINNIPLPPPTASERQVYFENVGWGPEWLVQYGPHEFDRYGDRLDEAGALAQWHRVNILGEES